MQTTRAVTGWSLLIPPTLALAFLFACASPKSADAPAAQDEEAKVEEVGGVPGAAPASEPVIGAESESARADDGPNAKPVESKTSRTGGSSSQLEIAIPMINGGLNRDIIRRTASDHADDVRGCHGRALAAMPGLAGTIVVALTIDADGHVSEAKLGETSTFASRDVEDCVLALAQSWEFPGQRGGEKTSVELAFELRTN
jgi:outer membrane biosynthesis protein TonB